MNEPLAYKIRPKTFDEIIGHKNIINFYKKMIEKNTYFSTVLCGNAGNGKTTISECFCNESSLKSFKFNASVDNKKKLQSIIEENLDKIILVVDEMHRMKKDIQDFLLPFLENGKVVLVGITSENPYYSINKAIRSRLKIFKLEELSIKELDLLFDEIIKKSNTGLSFKSSAKSYLIKTFKDDIRALINTIESLHLLHQNKEIAKEDIIKLGTTKNLKIDNKKDYYYNILSGLQKSIRGSDLNSALYYTSKMILAEDIDTLFRRLIIISYEDIGLANPKISEKVLNAYEAFKIVGLPEGRIIIGNIIIEMTLSPKSNSAYQAINKALDFASKDNSALPDNIKNNLIRINPKLYNYPHDSESGLNKQRYNPVSLQNINFYFPKDNSTYEKKLKERFLYIKNFKNEN